MTRKQEIKNFARGGHMYHGHRAGIARQLLEDPSPLDPLNSYLSDRFFKLQDGWSLLAFGSRDWEICDRLRTHVSAQIDANYLTLVRQYVASNRKSVRSLYAFNARLSDRLLQADFPDLVPGSDVLTPTEAQSLLNVRVVGAQGNSSGDSIRERLQALFTNKWCRFRLLYPLVYHFVEPTQSGGLDNFLDYVVTGHEHEAERVALKLLLNDEAARDETLAFKCFIGLMAHPYDACELVLDHAEFAFLAGTPLPVPLQACLHDLGDMLPGTRAARLAKIGDLKRLEIVDRTSADSLGRIFDLEDSDLDHYAQILALGEFAYETPAEAPSRPYQILSRMRATGYPVPNDFQNITGDAANWWFTEAGRLIVAALRSIYMIDRTAPDLEARDALRLAIFLGGASSLVAAAPSGLHALRQLVKGGFQIGNDRSTADIERRTAEQLQAGRPHKDRLWINDLQWSLRQLEQEGRILQWLQVVRQEANLRPNYLTGINWNWVEDVVERERLEPFLSWEGAYLFLLMENERSGTDSLRLAFTLDHLTEGESFEDILVHLIDRFGEVAPAFVRRYLTTQNLLAQGLAPNFMAALDQRVRAIEECIKALGFGKFLNEEVYETEKKTLTSELLLTSVNTGKFEVPWDMFRKDALEKQQSLFLAFSTLQPRRRDDQQDDAAARLMATIETVFNFPNGRSEPYKYKVYQAPLFSLLMALLRDFMDHPAFGLEVILSGRFRHSNLLQELWAAIAAVSGATIRRVSSATQTEIIDVYRECIDTIVEGWCSTYLHTRRKEKIKGLFDLVPSQKELEALLEQADGREELTQIIDVVVTFVRDKLRVQVEQARAFFEQDLAQSITPRFEQVRDDLLASNVYREDDVTRVHAAITQAIARKIEELALWFDGVDSTTDEPITLADLSMATAALFDNVLPGRTLLVDADETAGEVQFEPAEVKIAFDLVREVMFNALKVGRGPRVRLRIRHVENGGLTTFRFTNLIDPENPPGSLGPVTGCRYETPNAAVFREGNSGLTKVASSAATLVQEDVRLVPDVRKMAFHLTVPVRMSPGC